MKVSDVMTAQVVTAKPTTTVQQLAKTMSEIDSGAVPILEEMQALAQELGVEVDRRRRLAADEAERDDSQLGLL